MIMFFISIGNLFYLKISIKQWVIWKWTWPMQLMCSPWVVQKFSSYKSVNVSKRVYYGICSRLQVFKVKSYQRSPLPPHAPVWLDCRDLTTSVHHNFLHFKGQRRKNQRKAMAKTRRRLESLDSPPILVSSSLDNIDEDNCDGDNYDDVESEHDDLDAFHPSTVSASDSTEFAEHFDEQLLDDIEHELSQNAQPTLTKGRQDRKVRFLCFRQFTKSCQHLFNDLFCHCVVSLVLGKQSNYISSPIHILHG